MALLTIPPTRIDRIAAKASVRCASTPFEKSLEAVTYAADEHLLLALTAGLWVASRFGSAWQREAADYLALNVVTSAVLPHLLKGVVDRERPDRSVHIPRHGIPVSGKRYDAFPSGHAMHIGAVASVVSRLFPRRAVAGWTIGSLLATTRVLLLAHWLTDVLAGLTVGIAIERFLAACFHPRSRT
jgi:membrane-associated phospholipid phosphatase